MSDLQGLLERVAAALDRSGVPFMVAGSFASTAHGLPRTTQDLDLVIDPAGPDAVEALLAELPLDVYYVDADTARDALRRRTMFNVIDHASGWKIDFIIRKNRPFSREEMSRRREVSLLGVRMYVASPEDTVISKLEWSQRAGGSERQRRDIAGILATMGDGLDRAYLDRWIADLGLEQEWALAQKTAV